MENLLSLHGQNSWHEDGHLKEGLVKAAEWHKMSLSHCQGQLAGLPKELYPSYHVCTEWLYGAAHRWYGSSSIFGGGFCPYLSLSFIKAKSAIDWIECCFGCVLCHCPTITKPEQLEFWNHLLLPFWKSASEHSKPYTKNQWRASLSNYNTLLA